MDIAREMKMQLYLDDFYEADDVGVDDGGEEADLVVEADTEVGWEAREAHLLHGHDRLPQLGPPVPPVPTCLDRGLQGLPLLAGRGHYCKFRPPGPHTVGSGSWAGEVRRRRGRGGAGEGRWRRPLDLRREEGCSCDGSEEGEERRGSGPREAKEGGGSGIGFWILLYKANLISAIHPFADERSKKIMLFRPKRVSYISLA
jgi:hypothetical protein